MPAFDCDKLLRGDHALVAPAVAVFGCGLISQHQRHGARLFEQAHRVLNVDGIGVTIAGASPHRNIDGIGHTPDGVHHFLQSQKAAVRSPQCGGRVDIAGAADGVETRTLQDLGA